MWVMYEPKLPHSAQGGCATRDAWELMSRMIIIIIIIICCRMIVFQSFSFLSHLSIYDHFGSGNLISIFC
jgi:hypothetical protein